MYFMIHIEHYSCPINIRLYPQQIFIVYVIRTTIERLREIMAIESLCLGHCHFTYAFITPHIFEARLFYRFRKFYIYLI